MVIVTFWKAGQECSIKVGQRDRARDCPAKFGTVDTYVICMHMRTLQCQVRLSAYADMIMQTCVCMIATSLSLVRFPGGSPISLEWPKKHYTLGFSSRCVTTLRSDVNSVVHTESKNLAKIIIQSWVYPGSQTKLFPFGEKFNN